MELASMSDHRADDVLGDVRSVDAGGVRHGDAAVGERVDREVVRPRVHAGEQLQVLGHAEGILRKPRADRDAGGFEEGSLLLGRPRERDLVIRESCTQYRR